ncbi:hypothetical protein [Hyphococcus sp. DH-69]|uniref:hypothetical protein n=1 Tax=Hyphococcus formosus TaxID=3143534 RepID=UPI00398BB2EA
MQDEMTVPPGFEALQSFAKWNLMTANERTTARREATKDELRAFYDGVLPHIESILDECDKFELGALPESHRGIFNIALSMAEIAPHIEFYKGDTGVPFAFEEERFIAVHGEDETWQALPPNGPR